jgi:hypothetical protein
MVPSIRAADLVLLHTSEKTDHSNASIIACSGLQHSTAVAQIEVKGPQGLTAFRPVIQSVLDHGTAIAEPVSWTVITRQLRKYAQTTGCRSILCSDGCDAYIFIFPPNEPEEHVHFFWSWGDSTGHLTVRETLLFLIYFGPLSESGTYRLICGGMWKSA